MPHESKHLDVPIDLVLQQVHNGDAQLIDVRPQAEWDEGHFDEATRVPLADLQRGKDLGRYKLKKIPTYVLCGPNFTSMNALARLRLEQGLDLLPIRDEFRTLVRQRDAGAGTRRGHPGKEQHNFYDTREVRRQIDSGKAQLVDVRSLTEWDNGHLVHARHLDLERIKKGDIPSSLDKRAPLYVHCDTGMRAMQAAVLLKKHHGFDKVNPLLESYYELIHDVGLQDAEPELRNY